VENRKKKTPPERENNNLLFTMYDKKNALMREFARDMKKTFTFFCRY